MIEERYDHAAVSMGNKIYVIGGRKTLSCEVFDKLSRSFTLIKSFSSLKFTTERWELKALCIANDVFVLHNHWLSKITKVYSYDVGKQTWSNVDCAFGKSLSRSNFVKFYTH